MIRPFPSPEGEEVEVRAELVQARYWLSFVTGGSHLGLALNLNHYSANLPAYQIKEGVATWQPLMPLSYPVRGNQQGGSIHSCT
jgi:hypothetical protein